MSLWDFRHEDASTKAGANTQAGIKAGQQPFAGNWTQREKRNVILTDIGWVRRTNGSGGRAGRVHDEILVSAHPGGGDNNSYSSNAHAEHPDISQIYFQSGGAVSNGGIANVYVVFNQPLINAGLTGKLKLTVANTSGGNAVVAYANNGNDSNTVIGANNTVVFRFVTPGAGTYKVNSQTIANATSTSANLSSRNTGTRVANLEITGAVSNSAGSLVIS